MHPIVDTDPKIIRTQGAKRRYTLHMATPARNPEPLTRIVSVEVPNLDNPIVAAEYRRQREIINAAYERQREELEFWESAQSHEGWE
jgi:hypothetical protein